MRVVQRGHRSDDAPVIGPRRLLGPNGLPRGGRVTGLRPRGGAGASRSLVTSYANKERMVWRYEVTVAASPSATEEEMDIGHPRTLSSGFYVQNHVHVDDHVSF